MKTPREELVMLYGLFDDKGLNYDNTQLWQAFGETKRGSGAWGVDTPTFITKEMAMKIVKGELYDGKMIGFKLIKDRRKR